MSEGARQQSSQPRLTETSGNGANTASTGDNQLQARIDEQPAATTDETPAAAATAIVKTLATTHTSLTDSNDTSASTASGRDNNESGDADTSAPLASKRPRKKPNARKRAPLRRKATVATPAEEETLTVTPDADLDEETVGDGDPISAPAKTSVRKKAGKRKARGKAKTAAKAAQKKPESYWRTLPASSEPTLASLLDDLFQPDEKDYDANIALNLLSGHAANFMTAYRARLLTQGMSEDEVEEQLELAEVRAELESAYGRYRAAAGQIEQNRRERGLMEQLVSQTKMEADQARHEKEDMAQRLLDAEKALHATRSSTSWRLTSPLRGAVMVTRNTGKAVVQGPRTLLDKLRRKFARTQPLPIATLSKVNPAAPSIPQRVRIVGIGDGPIPSIFLGLDMPLSDIAVRYGGEFSLHYESDIPMESILRSADIVFVKRAFGDHVVKLVRFLREIETPVVYMMDDDFSALPADSPFGRRFRELKGPANVQRLCELADVTVTWTDTLAEKLRPYARKVMVFNGPSNVEIFDEMGIRPGRSDKQIRIGYAGGITHIADLEVIRPAVLGIMERNPNVDFETIGIEIPWLKGHPRYRHFEGAPVLKDYYRIVADRKWDLAVAPLVDSLFNSSKSDNKLREYAAAGYPAVYSRVPAFEKSVRDGENGLLVENTTQDWTAALEKLVSDSTLRASLAAGAKVDARGKYSRTAVHQQYEDLIARTTRPHRILAVGPTQLPTFAIDIDGPFKILRRKGLAHVRTRDISRVTREDLRWATTVVIVRAFEPDARALVRAAKRSGCKVVYSWDDNWVAFPRDDTALSKHLYDPANRESLFDVLREVDLIKATTPEIYEESLRHNKHVVSHPYGFDFDLTQHRPPTFRRDGRIRLGYFGTPGRDSQFDFVIEAIKNVQKKHDSLDLEFFGFNPARAKELRRVTNLPYADGYEASIRGLMDRHWDIALAPLADTTFNRSKLPTKYRDYAAVGAAGIYTLMPPYDAVVTNFRTGILAKNTVEAWTEAICRLVEDAELRQNIALEAFEHVRRNFSAEVAAQNWRDILDDLNARPQ